MLTPSASTLKSWLPRCIALTSKPGKQFSPVCIYIYSILNHAKKNNPILDIIFVCVCVLLLFCWGGGAGGAQCSLKHKSFQNYWPTKTIILNTLQVDEYLNQIVSIWLISNSECKDI